MNANERVDGQASEDREVGSPIEEGFSVRDDQTANWVVWQIVSARIRAERAAEFAKLEANRAEQQEQFFLHRFGYQLIDYAREKIREVGGRSKSVRLPAGLLSFRTQPSKVVVQDEEMALKWAKRHDPTLVVTVERLDKRLLDERVKRTGELPDGVDIVDSGEKFYVR
jgi:phage host-nuclease inhibitor protein Gam